MDEFIRELATTYGTPMYLYWTDRVHLAASDLAMSLPKPARLYYSFKANPHPEIARVLRNANCRAEVSSAGELKVALVAGYVGADCLYSGPAKSMEEIAFAIDSGVRLFSVESAIDLGRVSAAATEFGAEVDCLLRINEVASGATGLRMTGSPSQFGIDLAHLAEIITSRRPNGARIIGLHFFPISNAKNEESLLNEFRGSIRAAKRISDEFGIALQLLNLGGGFGAPYSRPGERPRYLMLRAGLEAALDDALPGWRVGAPEIIFESGRYLVADCGELVCSVMESKTSGDRQFTLLDSGVNHLGGMSGLGRLLSEARPKQIDTEATNRSTFVGPLCTPIDILSRNVQERPLKAGDLVTFPNVGAYGLTASLVGFLSRDLPVEIVLNGEVVLSATRLGLSRNIELNEAKV